MKRLTDLLNNEKFSAVIEKLTIDEGIERQDLEYMLSCAIIFIDGYCRDKALSNVFNFAYYILLKYSVRYMDYAPLYDFSANFGLFPISEFIKRKNILISSTVSEFVVSERLEEYSYNGIYETLEQKKTRISILSSEESEVSFVAPTSYGKSSIINEIVYANNNCIIGVIVPTKSLLMQTYRMTSNEFRDRKVIFHDDMYNGESNFIGVFTQERALRLVKEKNVYFDIIIIDEAHKIFEFDHRSILISRLLRKNKRHNASSRYYYLSPLIGDSNNLRMQPDQFIFEHRIQNNIKEPEITEFRTNGEVYKYNRFLDKLYLQGYSIDFMAFMIERFKSKNFFYLRAPRKVESLSHLLYEKLEDVDSEQLLVISKTLARNVHREFYCVKYVERGVIYLHGKLPDLVKEYLEYKFKECSEIKFIVANSVILEGVNLPIDNLYIMNTYKLKHKDLINLIGRVNRLNEVFSKEQNDLSKLLPSVNFVNSDDFNRKGGKMENQIKDLRRNVFKDDVRNPTLLDFDPSTIKNDAEVGDEDIAPTESQVERIIAREQFIIDNYDHPINWMKVEFLESNIAASYSDPEKAFSIVLDKINNLGSAFKFGPDVGVIEKVYKVFIEGLEFLIIDQQLSRLSKQAARDFYNKFVFNIHNMSIKEHIEDSLSYYRAVKDTPAGRQFYIGTSYGDFSIQKSDGKFSQVAYIDLLNKSTTQLVNIALVKIKIESDFLSFRLNEYVKLIYDFGFIDEKEYNFFIYGSESNERSIYRKIGLSGSLLNLIEKDGQTKNIAVNQFGRIVINDEFKKYYPKLDDFFRFELSKFIDF